MAPAPIHLIRGMTKNDSRPGHRRNGTGRRETGVLRRAPRDASARVHATVCPRPGEYPLVHTGLLIQLVLDEVAILQDG
jgi:hypothetical protein